MKCSMKKSETGYTLIELSISLTIIALLLTGGLGMVSKIGDAERYRITHERIEQVEAALVAFYKANEYLPCPAIGYSVETVAAFGVATSYDAVSHSCNQAGLTGQAGMVPVRTLNIADILAYDGWGRKLTYRLASGLGNSADFANNDYRGDLHVTDIAGNEKTMVNRQPPANMGAAYLVISGGPNSNATRGNIAVIDPDASGRANENRDHALNKIYIQNERTAEFSDILTYKQKSDFITLKAGQSPITIPSYVCSNAQKLATGQPLAALYNENNTLAGQVEAASKVMAALCNNTVPVCGMTPKTVDREHLMLWLDANDPNGTGNAGEAWSSTTWKNKSGQGADAYAQSSPAPVTYIPAALNGKSVMRFANNAAFSVDMGYMRDGPYTVFILYRYNNISPSSFYLMGANPDFSLGYPAADMVSWAQSQTEVISLSAIPSLPTVPVLSTITLNTGGRGKTFYLLQGGVPYVNGPDNRTAVVSDPQAFSAVMIGKRVNAPAGTAAFDGDIAEIVVYNKALSTNERVAVEGYLYRRWISGECQ